MKKTIITAFVLGGITAQHSFAQKYEGLSHSNFSGTYGGQYNPAKYSSNRVKFGLHLAGVNVLLNNDYYTFKGLTTLKSNELDNFGKDMSFNAHQTTMNIGVVAEVIGPSLHFTTGDRLGFGLASRVRIFSQGNQIDSEFIRAINKNYKGIESIHSHRPFGVNASMISDLGIGGSYTIVDNDKVRMSLGANLKMYKSVAFNSFMSKNYDMKYYDDKHSSSGFHKIDIHDADWEIYTSMKTNEDFDSKIHSVSDALNTLFGSDNVGTGFGGDIGLELSLKDNDGGKPYHVKFGTAVRDIGRIEMKNLQRIHITQPSTYVTLSVDPSILDIFDLNTAVDYLESKGMKVTRTNNATLSTQLPTHLTAYADVALSKKFFISASGLINLAPTTSYNSHYYNYTTLAPRWESKWLDVSVPLSYNFMSQDFKPGLAFRLGPLSVGSDDLKALFTDTKGANIYAGLGFLLYKKAEQPKDRDGDGILDKDDRCPDIAGAIDNQGCPWPDTDNDGVLDNDDLCVTVAGLVENGGCPYPDTDGDGVLDKNDQCPAIPGAMENHGCPWIDTDGDGILDKDDMCPTIPGLKEYKGCPKPKKVIAEEATIALRDILFDFNKSTISAVSYPKLDDAAKVINSSSDGNFLVTGHTDKKGNDAYNLKLSQERAAAVVKALEERGVSEYRLKSRGVGEQDATVPESASDNERMADRKVVVEFISDSEWATIKKSDLTTSPKTPTKRKATKKNHSKKRR